MNLHRMLLERAANNNPLRIGLIGAGKFGAMYLSQIPTTPGIHLLGIADMSPPRARENLAKPWHNIERIYGRGTIKDAHTVAVKNNDGRLLSLFKELTQ